jgi:hypothetical protein
VRLVHLRRIMARISHGWAEFWGPSHGGPINGAPSDFLGLRPMHHRLEETIRGRRAGPWPSSLRSAGTGSRVGRQLELTDRPAELQRAILDAFGVDTADWNKAAIA